MLFGSLAETQKSLQKASLFYKKQ